MKVENAVGIVRHCLSKRGYKVEERQSTSSASWYFKIYSGDTSLMFRVSDHSTSKNIITLRTDHKIDATKIQNFVNNRCKDLSYRQIKHVLGV